VGLHLDLGAQYARFFALGDCDLPLGVGGVYAAFLIDCGEGEGACRFGEGRIVGMVGGRHLAQGRLVQLDFPVTASGAIFSVETEPLASCALLTEFFLSLSAVTAPGQSCFAPTDFLGIWLTARAVAPPRARNKARVETTFA